MFSHPVYLFLREFSLQDFRGGSSIRWPDSLRQSMTSVLYPEQCIHVGDRESHCHEQFCLSPESHFCYKFILTNLLSMRNILFQ
ncbi:hypothetical protein C9Z82_13450 [Escherichia coli]|nr:hypothetical protein C9Z82_13450 [Escherichia coli]